MQPTSNLPITNPPSMLKRYITALACLIIGIFIGYFIPVESKQAEIPTLDFGLQQDRLFTEGVRVNSDPQSKRSQLVSIDAHWSRYTNYREGFEMDIPKNIIAYSSSISKANPYVNPLLDEPSDTNSAPVPFLIQEDGRRYTKLYPAYRLYDSATFINGKLNPDELYAKILTHPVDFGDDNYHVKLNHLPIKDEPELKQELVRAFSDCVVGFTKKPAQQTGMYDVDIVRTTGEDAAMCVNYHHYIKYSPEKQKALIVELSQECIIRTIIEDDESIGCETEDRMFNSFKFN